MIETVRRRQQHRWVHLGLGGFMGMVFLGAALAAWHVRAPAATPVVVADRPAVMSRSGPAGESYADLVARVAPAVVTVRSVRSVHQTQMPFDDEMLKRFFGQRGFDFREAPRRQAGLGSGVVVSADGYILTNHHVIDGADRVSVDLADGRSFEARIIGSDRPSDLAVLKVPATGLTTLPLGDSDSARVGDVVLAIGNPLGIGQTVTMGIISAKGRATGAGDGAFEDFIQTDAPINQGNSGGALVNTRGELVGINSQILSPVGYNIGIGFAIPVSMAQHVMSQLITSGTVHRGMLGVTVQGIDADLAKSLGLDQVRGAIVTTVQPDSAAAEAGLREGDVILALNRQPVDSSNDLRNQVARMAPGSEASLTVLRDRQERQLTAKLGELPSDRSEEHASTPAGQQGAYGLALEPLTPDVARRLGVHGNRGVLVTEVDPEGAAAEAGVQQGDVILQVNHRDVASVAEARSALQAATADTPVLLLVTRDGVNVFLTLSRGRS